jgi:hypothetical protein
LPFSKILKRDKTKDKINANKEMMFIYFFCDLKSDYLIINNIDERTEEIKKDIGLPDKWQIDSVMKEAIDFYESRTITTIGKLYRDALYAANAVADYLRNADVLLAERDDKGKPVTQVNTITSAINQVNKLMKDLKTAEIEVLKEQVDMGNKMKGSRQMGLFEYGIEID